MGSKTTRTGTAENQRFGFYGGPNCNDGNDTKANSPDDGHPKEPATKPRGMAGSEAATISPITDTNTTTRVAKPTTTTATKPAEKLLKVGSWNIRHGLIKHEQELKVWMENENLDIAYLVETDTTDVTTPEDYQILGYETILPLINTDQKTRIIALSRTSTGNKTKVRKDLMSTNFPSIWLEYETKYKKNTLIGGFYREWTQSGTISENEQCELLETLTDQMTRANMEQKNVIMIGDANLDSSKWDQKTYRHNKVATEMQNALVRNGMKYVEIGHTFLADRTRQDGSIIESSLDHIYIQNAMEAKVIGTKGTLSATDHVPIMAELHSSGNNKVKPKSIYKRSMKNFTEEKWKLSLAKQDWESIGETENVDEMTETLNNNVTKALDECAPFKTIIVRHSYKCGISQETKELIKNRDQTRNAIPKSGGERHILQQKYKSLRNRVTSAIRNDTKMSNDNRIKEAGDENEVWKVVKDIIQPKSEKPWSIKEGDKILKDEEEIAEVFNKHFTDKISKLKDNINQEYVEDPLQKLRKKMKDKNLKFALKKVSEKTVEKAMGEMNKKRSAGRDGLSQDKLIIAKSILSIPLTRIINASIEAGEFPKAWKEAVVTPILKKGDKEKKENYRPVSCLVVASKVMEKVVCDQTTTFMEKNNLFPANQHGFRRNRSTMTALAAMQQAWMDKKEANEKTGILLWDLTAAYDTMDTNLLCAKLEIYGFSAISVKWFRSFLTGRTQRVKIGTKMSSAMELVTGVPQGGILSPVLFIIFVADMEDWTEHSGVFTYADDTCTDSSSKISKEVMDRLEKDANGILKYMASNGLVANPDKTVFMMFGNKNNEELAVKVGDSVISQSCSAKLLGIEIDDDYKWKTQEKKLIGQLDKRLFYLRRLKGKISDDGLKKVADSLWTSKLRYGLQLISEVRTNEDQTKNTMMASIQKAQNRMMRSLTGTWRHDRIKIKDLLEKTNNLSVNQTAAQIKLTEMWKAANEKNYPVIMQKVVKTNERNTRNNQGVKFVEKIRSKLGKSTFAADGPKLWNNAPESVTSAISKWKAKKAIKTYCKSLPL